MLLRVLAVLAAIAVPLLLTIEGISRLHPAMFWIGPLAAILLTLPIIHTAEGGHTAGGGRSLALLGAALAAMAAATTPELPQLLNITADEDSLQVHDLRKAPLPSDAEGYVAVRGYLRDEWVVDQYFPQPGERPDQNEAPAAVMLPLLGTTELEMHAEELGRVVVARVRPEVRHRGPLVTLRGKLGPADAEIVESLFIMQVVGPGTEAGTGPVSLPQLDAVQLDTFDVPTRGQAWTRLGLAVAAALASLALLLFALPRTQTRSL